MASLRLSELPLHLKQNLAAQVLAVLVLLQFFRCLYSRFTRISISYLPGPPKSDWLFGNLPDLFFEEVGVSHFSWQKKYGSVFKVYGLLGDEYLMTSDPKAMQHIYSSTLLFGRQTQNRELVRIAMGPGVPIVIGDDHKRHRRVMQPAFGLSQLKALFPVFSWHCKKLLSVMKKDIEAKRVDGRKVTIDVYEYSARASLDIIGDASFDYQFGALDDKQDDLRDAYHDMEVSLRSVNKFQMFFQFAMEWLPLKLILPMSYLPIKKFADLHTIGNKLDTIAGRLIKDKTDTYMKGLEGGKDLMSLLVKANANQGQKTKLSDVEVRSEIAAITTAGQGMTATAVAFALWELAKDMDLQRRIRQEITQTLQRVQEQGGTEITFDDYDDMSLLVAFIKEILRWHPTGFSGAKQALQDTSIPLSHPIKLKSGKIVDEIPISKGQKIWVNIPGYNRAPEVFGEDSYEFNVNRWLNGTNNEKHGVGIYAGLITFGHGPRFCIGWRFSLLQMQMMLIDMISSFEYTLPKGESKVFRTAAGTMIPTVRGDKASGAALFLDASII